MMKDPYLIPGQLCEVWNNENYWAYYFYKYDCSEREIFLKFKMQNYYDGLPGLYFDNYRPIGTEWDFAPGWAICSTVDKNGTIVFWDTNELYPAETGGIFYINSWHSPDDAVALKKSCGICPDKSRYEGKSWKTSLRMRPDWAEVKNNTSR